MINTNEVTKDAVVNQNGTRTAVDAKALPARAEYLYRFRFHAASNSVMVSSSLPPLTIGILFTL